MNIVDTNEEQLKTTRVDPEKLADKTAEKVVELLGKSSPVRRLRNSQLLSLILGAAGFSLFTIGVGKLFGDLSGWASLGIGLVMMAITGALLKNLER
ncbi:hypothetical protein A3A70_03000 [candidate division WWE3 bacterium RIFCSPLOWO2_01_FULL_42_11]|uniref:Uncharacterized protein n=2 Tax=Bacteria candidate phyla TaxID=1783234 RepID=A0A1F4VRK0_UNCKA|nr:MAG: hypothetical protein A3A70_03000 [candidate division WWE3 bacterium RIFCSPLOWO2_01_FULL_42_11]OGG15294.1 MAG: hypothetical protein A2773_03095 [Candidatus Gottesmanbacteria bacterium RIFCSPHIGHO2_01_FULL_39_10]